MPRYESRRWEAEPGALGGRRARASYTYRAFVPDAIAGLEVLLPSAVAATVSASEREVAALEASGLEGLEVLARRLLRAESVASSRIEGLELSHRRLARAEAGGPDARDETARSILGNVAAMEQAVARAGRRAPLRAKDLLAIHATLVRATSSPQHAGEVRLVQNWIGGGPYGPRDAEFVPPPPELVPGLLDDLCAFCARVDLPPIVQAAIAHAQFESIHPFADGNGRVGRALVHVILRRRGLTPRYVPPVSLVLAGNAMDYVAGLTAYRAGDVGAWCETFAAATATAAREAAGLARALEALRARWRERAGRPRRDSAAHALLELLPGNPIVSVATAQALTGRSKQAANEAVASLEAAGVLRQVSIGRRNRAWEAPEVFELVDAFERHLATLGPAVGRTRRRPYGAPRR